MQQDSYAHGASDVPLLNDTISKLLRSAAKKHPDRLAFAFPAQDVHKTYAEFEHDVRTLETEFLPNLASSPIS